MPSLKGESQANSAQLTVGRRPQSKVRVRVVGCSSMGWVEAAEAWGAEVEVVVVHTPDILKDSRQKISLTPTTTPQDALRLLPLGPWDGCLLANIALGLESQLISALFKQWRPAVAILSIHALFSRSDTIAMLPTGLPPFYHKKTLTLRHSSIGGVASAAWRFVHYSRWESIISYPSFKGYSPLHSPDVSF